MGDDTQRSPKMLSLDGLEIIAVLVVMGLFIKVLEQFGMFDPVGGEGNRIVLFSGVVVYKYCRVKTNFSERVLAFYLHCPVLPLLRAAVLSEGFL